MSVPERAENCGQQRSPTGNPNGIRRGYAQVDPLPETTCDETPCLAGDCVESSQVSSAGPNAGNAPLTSPLAIMGARWHARAEFHSSAGATSVA